MRINQAPSHKKSEPNETFTALIVLLLVIFASIGLSSCAGYTTASAGNGSQSGNPASSISQISATPANVNFGSVIIGTSNSQTITLKNSGNSMIKFSQVSTAGIGFSITGLSNSSTIAGSGSVAFNAVFAPTSTASVSGSVTLTTDAEPSQLVISLSGSGSTSSSLLSANPTSLNFNTVTVGSNSSLTSTLTNDGNSNISISGVALTGTGLTARGVSGGMVLMPGQSATLTVTFAPTTTETLTGASVQIASNATNSPLAIAVSGASQIASSHSVQLLWTASSTSGVSYDIFRANTSGGYGSTPLNPSPVAGTTYIDTTVVSGQTYFYVATAVDSAGSSADSNEVSVTIP